MLKAKFIYLVLQSMPSNKDIVANFYSAFQRLDYRAMNACYVDDIVFSDPVFGLLRGDEVRYMWEMLCRNANEFSLQFSNIKELDEEYTTCEWVASYTFSKTGKRVVNRIKTYMRFRDGKIIEHSDAFRLSKWAAQALGWKGKLLGWSNFFKRKIQRNAQQSLIKFIEKKEAEKVNHHD